MQESKWHVLFQKLFVMGGKHQSLLLFFTIQALFLILTVYASFGLLRYLSINVEGLGFLRLTLRPVIVFWLVVIIAVHEFGHLFWIRKFGIPVLGPIPILFAGAMTLNGRRLTSKEAISVYLAGPFTGFISIPIVVWGVITKSQEIVILGLAWAFINVIQLFPLYPSDGGVTLVVILSSIIGKKWAKRIGYGITIGLFIIVLALSEENWNLAMFILIITAIIMLSDRYSMNWFARYSEKHFDMQAPKDEPLGLIGFSSIIGAVVYWSIAAIYLVSLVIFSLMYIS